MKAFWALIAFLVVVTAVVWLRPKSAPAPAPVPELTAREAPVVPEVGGRAVAEAPVKLAAEAPVSAPALPVDVAPSVPVQLVPEVAAKEASAPIEQVVTGAKSLEQLDVLLGLAEKPLEEEIIVNVPTRAMPESEMIVKKVAPEEDPAGAAASGGPVVMFKDREVVPARRKHSDDGTLILDERFPLTGAGTKEDPYQVTWDYLVSASETFQPRMGKNRLPERVVMLDQKYVKVTGYVAFPIMATAQNEMLSMRNMWDGCCIGMPPTPYDAIEVRLKDAATGKDRFTNFGVVEGVFSVDPYVKGNWLLGLYLLDQAVISQMNEGDNPSKHGGL